MARTSSRSLEGENTSPGWVTRLTRMASSSTLRLPRKWMRTTLSVPACSSPRKEAASSAYAGTARHNTVSSAALRKVAVILTGRAAVLDHPPVDHGVAPGHVRGQLRIVGHDEHG